MPLLISLTVCHAEVECSSKGSVCRERINYLEHERLVELRIEGLAVHLRLELLLLVRQQVDLYVGIRSAAHVQGRQLLRLDHGHRQTVRIEVVLELEEMSD